MQNPQSNPLSRAFFSLPVPIEADISCRQDNEITFKKVTYIEVQKAFSLSSLNTAASANQINYTMFK